MACSPDSSSPHFGLWNDTNLSYVGNPSLSRSRDKLDFPYIVSMLSTLNLQANLDGVSSCSGTMNLNWMNTAAGGHLTSPGASGQDNFTSTSTSAAYTALATLPAPVFLPVDNITVNFLPDPANPPAAQSCATLAVTMPDQIMHVVFDGQEQSSYTTTNGYHGGANLTRQHDVWDVHIPSSRICNLLSWETTSPISVRHSPAPP